jgi:PAS domain-containing protein
VVDARDFFYSRIAMAMGDDVVLEVLDRDGNWQYVNEYFARLYDKKRSWFIGKNRFDEFPELGGEWKDILRTVSDTRETYVDRSFRGLPPLPAKKRQRWNWNILVFPLKLHDNRNGAVLSARVIEKK